MCARLMCLIGAARAAAIACLSRRQRAELIDWLAPLEAMARKLLLIEAAALPPCTKSVRQPARAGEGACTARKHGPAFNLIPVRARERAHPARIRQLGGPILVRDMWSDAVRMQRIAHLRAAPKPAPGARLANRVAALLRVIDRPLVHARRLARLMARLARRAGRIARCVAEAPLRRRPMMFHVAAYDQTTGRAQRTGFVNSS